MEDKHIGSLISVDCGKGNYYQGKLTAVDASTKNITIANAFREGIPLGKCVTINSSDINTLKVLKPPAKKTNAQKELFTSKRSEKKTEETEKNVEGVLNKLFQFPPQNNSNKLGNSVKNSISKDLKSFGKKYDNLAVVEKKIANEIAETPLYRDFERQIPNPTALSKILTNNGRSPNTRMCNKKQGPSGIPLLDALNCYKGYGKRKNETNLEGPIDFDLESDFDFDENLKLFEKEDIDEEYYETVEKLKISQNFAHYENIVDDEERVISWTNIKSRMSKNEFEEDSVKNESKSTPKIVLNSVNFEKTANGQPIPAISGQQKKEFLKVCSETMGENVLHTILADRFFSWFCNVQERHGVKNGSCALIASSKNSVRFIRRILTHFDKRSYNCHLYGKYPGEEFDNVKVVNSLAELPKSAIVCVLSQEVNEEVENWLKNQTESHFICFESIINGLDPKKIHLIMFGCATAGLRHVAKKLIVGRTCFDHLSDSATSATIIVDSAVADIGSPTNWFDDCSKQFISSAFSSTFLVQLSSF